MLNWFMLMFKKSSTRGFTIIEVMIALAIAALILLIVLLVVPNIMRNERNLERKHYLTFLQARLVDYNNDYGNYPKPSDLTSFRNYVKNESNPNFTITTIMDANSSDHTVVPQVDEFVLAQDHWCNKYGDGNNATDPIAGHGYHPGVFAIWTSIETASGTSVFCVDNRR